MLPLQTSRLRLRDFTIADKADYCRLRTGEQFGRYYPEEELTPAFSEYLLQLFMAWQTESPRRRWQLAIVDRDSGTLMGSCGVREVHAGVMTLGYELGEAYWRAGYACEAVAALVSFARDKLNCHEVFIDTLHANQSAIAIAQRLGFAVASEAEPAREFRGQTWPSIRLCKTLA